MPSSPPNKTTQDVRPVLKWAGGKTQLLDSLLPLIPDCYERYIEPFFGGGALFFALKPEQAIISDSNPELINLYKVLANDLGALIECLEPYENDKELFLHIRSLDWTTLPAEEAAARTIFLNKTCFNGLYRVNKKGMFNVPFGNYKNPKIINRELLEKASHILQNKTIICSDYSEVITKHAKKGDIVFLDPPYVPISKNSDFKRYTKNQFYEKDHIELAEIVKELGSKGCHTILTNSNAKLVHELYSGYDIQIHKTKRNINCRGKQRQGEDVIINIPPN